MERKRFFRFIPVLLLVGLAFILTRCREGFQDATMATLAEVKELVARIDVLLVALRAAPTVNQSMIDSVSTERERYAAVVTAGADPTSLGAAEVKNSLDTINRIIQRLGEQTALADPTVTAASATAPEATVPVATSPVTTAPATTPQTKQQSNTGLYIGLGLGGVLILGIAIFIFMRRSKKA